MRRAWRGPDRPLSHTLLLAHHQTFERDGLSVVEFDNDTAVNEMAVRVVRRFEQTSSSKALVSADSAGVDCGIARSGSPVDTGKVERKDSSVDDPDSRWGRRAEFDRLLSGEKS